ncbi:hypothetical protein [Enterococcus thailandicus]|uniref:hypothetical protein n=1 Tax=Enterococcus thailandicus TaxID=417368 RepID=UPI0022DF51F2|nr:hypothetical protein [Enterococcus thailandicus]
MKYIYTPVSFTEIARGLENGELKAKDIFFETKNFKGIRLLADTKLDLEDCTEANFYLKKEVNKPMKEIKVPRKRPKRRT